MAAPACRSANRPEHDAACRPRGARRAAPALLGAPGRCDLAARTRRLGETSRVDPQRRTALVSVVAAVVLIVLKLSAGLASNSLGLVSEALHSGMDLVAALLTFFALGVAVRPADVAHQYGHGKAQHLSALAEAAILVAASCFIAWRAITHLVGAETTSVEATWYAFAVIGIVIVVDVSRTVASWRAAQR